MNPTSRAGLVRGIGRWDLVAVAINGIIGAGIFGLPSKVFSLIGSYSRLAFVACALVVMLIFIAAGLFFLNPHAYVLGPRPSSAAFSQSVLLLIYAFTGFEMAVIPAGEVRDPQKHLPRALLIAIAVVALFYILIQIVCVGTLPGLAQSEKPLADAATRFLGAAGGAIISAGAIISITGNLNIVLLSGSRVPFAMAEQNQLPSFVAKVHRRF